MIYYHLKLLVEMVNLSSSVILKNWNIKTKQEELFALPVLFDLINIEDSVLDLGYSELQLPVLEA